MISFNLHNKRWSLMISCTFHVEYVYFGLYNHLIFCRLLQNILYLSFFWLKWSIGLLISFSIQLYQTIIYEPIYHELLNYDFNQIYILKKSIMQFVKFDRWDLADGARFYLVHAIYTKINYPWLAETWQK